MPRSVYTMQRHDRQRNGKTLASWKQQQISRAREQLPIYRHKERILYSIESCSVVVIVGETACGKSTQIPQYLAENGWDEHDFQIVCTQPRRMTAMALATRVSEEIGRDPLGGTVGFCDLTSSSTRIKFTTDEMLLSEATLDDPLLSRYSVVIVDDAHERSTDREILLGLLKTLLKRRTALRVIICSASIDADSFLDFFLSRSASDTSSRRRKRPRSRRSTLSGSILRVEGRRHPVDVQYLKAATSNYILSLVETVFDIVRRDPNGDILCFLPSRNDIDYSIQMAESHQAASNGGGNLIFLPFESGMTWRQPRTPEDLDGKTKVVLTTGGAESAFTIANIKHVVDTGMETLAFFDPKSEFTRLIVVPISKVDAEQRAGRVGRDNLGKCFRLYTEQYFAEGLPVKRTPEIQRSNLSSFLLNLKALGVENVLAFDLMDIPSPQRLAHAMESLFALGAIDRMAKLTKLGLDMSNFHMEPHLSRIILRSVYECPSIITDIAGIASILQVRSIFLPSPNQPRRRSDAIEIQPGIIDSSGDHVSFANLLQNLGYMKRSEVEDFSVNYGKVQAALRIRRNILAELTKHSSARPSIKTTTSCEDRSIEIRKCILSGFLFNIARMQSDGRYYSIRNGQNRIVAPSRLSFFYTHGVHSSYVVFSRTHDGFDGQICLDFVSAIDPRWLREVLPHYWE